MTISYLVYVENSSIENINLRNYSNVCRSEFRLNIRRNLEHGSKRHSEQMFQEAT